MPKHRTPKFPALRQPNPDSPERQPQLVRVTYEAPLPPPHMLEQYERTLPGLADRIVTRMEQQTEHRHGLENRKIDSDIVNEKRGQVFAFILALVAIIASFILIWNGINTPGLTLFITTFAGLVGVFIYGRYQQNKELARKRSEMKALLPQKGESDPLQ